MNTFVPSEHFDTCSALIVWWGGTRSNPLKRLNKQVAECGQILRVIDKIYRGEPGGWQSHPAVKMWVGYDAALFAYMLACDKRRVERYGRFRHKEILRVLAEFPEYDESMRQENVQLPPWWGGPIHQSHQLVLIAKRDGRDPKPYYYWPTQLQKVP